MRRVRALLRGQPQPRLGPDSGYSATAGLPFDDVDLESRLVWIWGSPRSGSTWLLRQLCHPARLSARFPVGFAPPPAWRSPLDAVPVDEFLVSRHIAPPSGEPVDVDGGLVPATLNNYVGDFPGYAFARAFADVWGPELRRLVLVRLAATLERAAAEGIRLSDAPLILIKEVNGSHASDVVMSLFPRSRMLFLVRDGRDVLDSRVHAHGEGGWLAEVEGAQFRTPAERLAWVRSASREWVCNMDATRRAHDAHDPERRRVVGYEELLADPAGGLRSLFAWLGLARDSHRVEEIVADTAFSAIAAERRGESEPFRAATPGLWRRNLTADEQEVAEAVMGERLVELGYAVAGRSAGGSASSEAAATSRADASGAAATTEENA